MLLPFQRLQVVTGKPKAEEGADILTLRSAEYANKVVDIYMTVHSDMFRAEADAAFRSLEGEVARAGAELAALDQKRLEFDVANKVVLDFEKDKLVVGAWAAMQSSVNDLKASIASLEASRAVMERQLASEPAEIVSGNRLEVSRAKALPLKPRPKMNNSRVTTDPHIGH